MNNVITTVKSSDSGVGIGIRCFGVEDARGVRWIRGHLKRHVELCGCHHRGGLGQDDQRLQAYDALIVFSHFSGFDDDDRIVMAS